eukprot:5746509-Pyramimonas_sp.AAC.1
MMVALGCPRTRRLFSNRTAGDQGRLRPWKNSNTLGAFQRETRDNRSRETFRPSVTSNVY